ncbi:MAG: response regulator [Chloroflexota bacterium]
MTHILVIDDEIVYHTLIARAFEGFNYKITNSDSGMKGLFLARSLKPDVIICDVMMPDMIGYEVVSSLRRDPEFAHTPILMLTAQSGLQDKLKAFEAGADDHLTKPFEPEELAARISVLLRRAELVRTSTTTLAATTVREDARVIAVHSLRGGTGCSSLAVNLALGLQGLWKGSTCLVDLTMMAGQVALMLNASLKRTWADIARDDQMELDNEVIDSILSRHDSGLEFVAAPTLPTDADMLKIDTLAEALRILKKRFDYIVIDLPHDFHEMTLQALDIADQILMVATPDMASVRATAAALDTFKKLGYPKDQLRMVINATFPRQGLQYEKIATALGVTISMVIPYSPDLFVEAINAGKPFIMTKPNDPISELIEDYAFNLSKPAQKKSRPDAPSEAWLRVYKRYNERKK